MPNENHFAFDLLTAESYLKRIMRPVKSPTSSNTRLTIFRSPPYLPYTLPGSDLF